MTSELKISAEEPNWSALPLELLNTIGCRSTKLKDFIRFRAVCKRWRQALASSRFRQSIPWLMLPYCRNNSPYAASARVGCTTSTDCCRCFYDVEEQQFHHIESPQGLNKTCRGSDFGWVFMMESSPSLSLLNPITNDNISLPPITAFPDVLEFRPEHVGIEYLHLDCQGLRVAEGKKRIERHYISKVSFSTEPTMKECVVMVIRTGRNYTLAFCKPYEDQKWTVIPPGDDRDLPKLNAFTDVVFWKGQFYALVQDGRVYVCDLSLQDCPRLSLFIDAPQANAYHNYLVISPTNDELMMVTRYLRFPEEEDHDDCDDDDDDGGIDIDDELSNDDYDDDHDEYDDGDNEVDDYCSDSESDDENYDHIQLADRYRKRAVFTGEFKVFKVHEDRRRWDEVGSIGDFALFLGYNTATWISIKDHPQITRDSIYFTDDLNHRDEVADMGVYNLRTQTINQLYSTASVHENPYLISPLPVWILPSNH
ncbi:unnamed protein product [Linum trigynum]|uniref:F-box domain-containing protein n=1 Tax=Linum trigynum TaxID=586398 RepID=A0AAV2FPK9_9ROSI